MIVDGSIVPAASRNMQEGRMIASTAYLPSAKSPKRMTREYKKGYLSYEVCVSGERFDRIYARCGQASSNEHDQCRFTTMMGDCVNVPAEGVTG